MEEQEHKNIKIKNKTKPKTENEQNENKSWLSYKNLKLLEKQNLKNEEFEPRKDLIQTEYENSFLVNLNENKIKLLNDEANGNNMKNFKHKMVMVNELEDEYQNKLREISQKKHDYDIKHLKLEEKIDEYEKKIGELLEKKKEYNNKVDEIIEKSNQLEEAKVDYKTKNKRLDKAREQFKDLSLQMDLKRQDFRKKESKLAKIQENLEKSRFQLEQEKIDFEDMKLKFEKEKANLKQKTEISHDEISLISEDITQEKNKHKTMAGPKGRSKILKNILENVLDAGYFQSCFLIDENGMLVSEFYKKELDSNAIGAMFSLIHNSVLRTIKSLNLLELKYFKLAAGNGEFLMNSIKIENYENNFILLCYYNNDKKIIQTTKDLSKDTIRQIYKNLKKDLKECRDEQNISWAFDNLIEKINFLKKTSLRSTKNFEEIRINSLKKAKIKIKNLFETI